MIPLLPEFVEPVGETVPSTISFLVNASNVFAPQTGHPWIVEMDHEMSTQIYSLVPQKNDLQFVQHLYVETRRPRIVGSFKFMDAWLTTHHKVHGNVHFSQTFFNPERADDKLYFREAKSRMEIIVPGFIGDREILTIVEEVLPRECEIRSLLQRQS